MRYRYIDDFSPGKTYKLIRNLDPIGDGSVITDAWFTVKSRLSDSDARAQIAMHITVSGGGVVNYPDFSMALNFIVPYIESKDMLPNEVYHYDIQALLNTGDVYTLEEGKLFTTAVVTNLP